MNAIERQVNALKKFSAVVRDLNKTGVIRSSRYTGDIGEWYVEQLYSANRSPKQTETG